MSAAWQNFVVVLAVAAAAGYLAVAAWRAVARRRAACGGCPRCPAGDNSHEQQVVPLGSFQPRPPREPPGAR